MTVAPSTDPILSVSTAWVHISLRVRKIRSWRGVRKCRISNQRNTKKDQAVFPRIVAKENDKAWPKETIKALWPTERSVKYHRPWRTSSFVWQILCLGSGPVLEFAEAIRTERGSAGSEKQLHWEGVSPGFSVNTKVESLSCATRSVLIASANSRLPHYLSCPSVDARHNSDV